FLSDFNLQEEASIPEDIFDQHDGDIEDEDAGVSAQLQYPSAPLGPGPSQDYDQDPDPEKQLPAVADQEQEQDESDDDASEAADIILESQRPASRNFSAYLDAKKYPNNNASKRSKDKDWPKDKDKGRKNNLSHYNYKLKNNKERVGDKEAPGPAPAPAPAPSFAGKPRDADFPPKLASSAASSVEDIQEDSANFGRKSFSHKKLKNMHEQQNQQKEHPTDAKESREQDPSSPQLFDSIEILNERKFNKPIGAEQVQTGETAIGDIEDNLDNDEESDQQQQQEQEEDEQEEEEEEGFKSSIDNDELAKRYYPPTTTTEPTTLPTTTSTSTTSTTTAQARSSTTTKTTTPRTTTTLRTSRTPQQQPTIGHKLKRHGSAFGPKKPQSPENRYYEIARIKQEQEQEQEETASVGELHYYDTGSNYNQKLATYDPEKSEENYLSGQHPRRNASDRRGASSAARFLDDEYSEPQPPPEEQRQWESPAGNAEGFGVGKLEADLDSGAQRYHSGSLATATPTPASAFERFKALRRSRQRTGHKSHKKRYKDYLKWQDPEAATPGTLLPRHLQKLQKEQDMERERERERQKEKEKQRLLGHTPPIFALGLRPAKPFYEGQVSYYDKQEPVQDLEQEQQGMEHRTEMERLIAHNNGNWYRRISPVLRNGVKSGVELKHHRHRGHHLGHHQGHHPSHHHLQNHHHHHHHHQNSHKSNHLRSRPSNPYQRKPSAQNPMAAPPPGPEPEPAPLPAAAPGSEPGPQPTPTPPIPPPKQELGHQITELEHLERYYAKWPHLARVQFQVYDEHYREAHPELYEDYEDDDYESAAELEEAQQENGEEANLPPYIKKYNRRNKQLLNLLEGTLPTPTAFPPAGGAGSPPPPHLDDEYLQEKRRRYHQHHFEDLFAQQKSAVEHKDSKGLADEAVATTPFSNHLPEDSPEGEYPAVQQAKAPDFWPGKVQVVVAPTATPKPALFKLPSYPAIAGSFLGTPRSRSAQFVANVAGRGQSSWTQNSTGSAGAAGAAGGGVGAAVAAGSPPRGAPSPLNSFVYHRVVDGPGNANGVPPVSGIGIGRRQSRLPFVAITDRRMESLTGKRSLAERHKDFQQNHFAMP
ncbi:hypothetical protein KR067_001494, partial [Drosophila pandora]